MSPEQVADQILVFWPSDKRTASDLLSSQDLFADGWLTSLVNLQLVVSLEKSHGKKIPLFKVTRSNFKTASNIASLLNGI